MNKKLYQRKGFYHALFTSVLIFFIVLGIEIFKMELIPETGKLKYPDFIVLILALGLVLRWKHVRQILGVISSFASVLIIFSIITSSKEFILARSLLLLALVLVSYLLVVSRALKNYIE
jgi:hypothetical protein